jgi:hypothetical protein
MRFGPAERWFLARYALVVYASGAALYAFSHWVRVESPVGPQHHPAEWWVRVAHSLLTYGTVGAIGYLAHAHVIPGLRAARPRRRPSGLGTLGVFGALLLSAVFLLYSGETEWTGSVAQLHGLTGLALPGLILFHSRLLRRGQAR